MNPLWDDLIAIDCETTGTGNRDSIITVSVCGQHFTHTWVIRHDEIPAEATAVNQLTPEWTREHCNSSPDQMMNGVAALMRVSSAIAIFNASFDLRMLRLGALRTGVELPTTIPIIDPMRIHQRINRQQYPSSLAAVYEQFTGRTLGGHHAPTVLDQAGLHARAAYDLACAAGERVAEVGGIHHAVHSLTPDQLLLWQRWHSRTWPYTNWDRFGNLPLTPATNGIQYECGCVVGEWCGVGCRAPFAATPNAAPEAMPTLRYRSDWSRQ